MTLKLFLQALLKFALGAAAIGFLLFVSAGSTSYWNGWLFMSVLLIPMLIAGFVMMAKAPDLLRSRLDAKENEGTQKAVILLSGLMFIGGFVLSGFNYRFGWYPLPKWIVYTATAVFLIAYLLYAEVLRENAYLSRTIKVQAGQQVVDTGLYGIIRHPMYAVTLVLFLAMPLILGSLQAFLLFLIYPVLIAKRIQNEEAVLEKELCGYTEYKQKVRFRLIPFIW